MSRDTLIGEGVMFESIRRITGYLAPVSRWNNGKRAELRERVAHECVDHQQSAEKAA